MNPTSLLAPLDYEKRAINEAREALQDIHYCNNKYTRYRIHWIDRAPVLMIAFDHPELSTIPAVGVRLATMPSNTLLEGDKLRSHVRRSVEQYLLTHGARIVQPSD